MADILKKDLKKKILSLDQVNEIIEEDVLALMYSDKS